MARLRTLLLCLMTMLFVVGGIARAAPPPAGGPPPCHMTAMDKPGPAQAPKHKPAPDMMAMNCCLGCLPSAAAQGPFGVRLEHPTRIAFEAHAEALEGRSLPPELGPPRAA